MKRNNWKDGIDAKLTTLKKQPRTNGELQAAFKALGLSEADFNRYMAIEE